jgi:hypothetical protein
MKRLSILVLLIAAFWLGCKVKHAPDITSISASRLVGSSLAF